MKPTFVTIIIFNAVYIYNEFPFASTFIQNNALNTVSLMTSMFKGQYTMDYSGIIAARDVYKRQGKRDYADITIPFL